MIRCNGALQDMSPQIVMGSTYIHEIQEVFQRKHVRIRNVGRFIISRDILAGRCVLCDFRKQQNAWAPSHL